MTRQLLLVSIFISFMLTCYGQRPEPESRQDALRALKQNMPDSNRQYLYNYVGTLYLIDSRFDSCFYYLRKAVYLGDSLNLNNATLTNESLSLLAQAYLWSGNVAMSKKIYLQVIGINHQHHQLTNEARTWYRMGQECWYQKAGLELVPGCFDNAIVLFGQDNNIPEKSQAMFDKINYLTAIGNHAEADQLLQQLLTLAKTNHFEYFSAIYSMIAKKNRYSGNLNTALAYGLESIKYIDSAKNKNALYNFYGEVAQVYEDLGEAEQSIAWYKQCIAQRERSTASLYGLYRTMSLMTIQMVKAKREGEAIILLQQLEKRKPPQNHATKAALAQSLAYCYSAMKQYKPAEAKFVDMIKEYAAGETNVEILYIAYYDIAKFYVDFGEYTRAQTYLQKLTAFGEISIPRSRDLYLLLFKADSANGKFTSAIQYYQKYKAYNDSLFNEAKSRQVNELMIKYETEKKDQLISLKEQNIQLLTKQGELQTSKLSQTTLLKNITFAAIGLLIIIMALLFNRYHRNKKTNTKLEEKQKEINKRNIALEHLVTEKEWLLKELHHRVKNNLQIVMSLLNSQSAYLENDHAIAAIHNSQHRVHAMLLIHQKLYNLENLSTINMPAYISELVRYLEDCFNTRHRINFKMEVIPLELDVSQAIPIGLILNEAITNAIKHAFPGNRKGTIQLNLSAAADNRYLLTISDDGIGIPATDLKDAPLTSLGMSLMMGLSEDIDGSMTITNNNGTVLQVTFVYDAADKYSPVI